MHYHPTVTYILGSDFPDWFTLIGYTNRVLVYGFDGEDVVRAYNNYAVLNIDLSYGNDEVYGEGNSFLNALLGPDNDYGYLYNGFVGSLDGGAGDDSLGGSYNYTLTLNGGEGNNFLFPSFNTYSQNFVGTGNNTVDGYGNGSFSVSGGGGVGTNTVYGSQNITTDINIGGWGNTEVNLTLGPNDYANIMLGEGDDAVRIFNDGGFDFTTLNGGNDLFRAYGDGTNIVFAGNGNDVVDGGDGQDIVFGGADTDILNGHAGSDSLFGDEGNDILIGGAGQDYLSGGAGNDLFIFRAGAFMVGGGGADMFASDFGNESGVATIADFNAYLEGDVLDVSHDGFTVDDLFRTADGTLVGSNADHTVRYEGVDVEPDSSNVVTAGPLFG